MTKTILDDAFGHHLWGNEQVLAACAELSAAQLMAPVPGTYGPIIATLRHLVQADSFYLWVNRGSEGEMIPAENELTVAELREANERHAAGYRELLAGRLDAEAEVAEHGDGWDFVATMGLRVAQIVHHGSDHRSQICTALTGLGVTPPEIDLWAYGRELGVTREVDKRAG
ncbi:MAG TPA: DinB family protein [Candidatus Limnocylindria bacterium]|nr:DinB family protein [Candidatus Limnocylindria bacterium]